MSDRFTGTIFETEKRTRVGPLCGIAVLSCAVELGWTSKFKFIIQNLCIHPTNDIRTNNVSQLPLFKGKNQINPGVIFNFASDKSTDGATVRLQIQNYSSLVYSKAWYSETTSKGPMQDEH